MAVSVVTLSVHICGLNDSLQHSGVLKDPFNRWTRKIKEHSRKTKKTDEDHNAMLEAEFKGSLYCRDDEKGEPIYWPSDNIHACIRAGGKLHKLGTKINQAMVVGDDSNFTYKGGPKTRDELWEDESFRFTKSTKRGTMSCRPRFTGWELKFTVNCFTDLLNVNELKRCIHDAGRYVGLSDWPRKFGHFEVVKIKETKNGK